MNLAFDGFDWDLGNLTKNYLKHGIRHHEAEEVILNGPLIFSDDKHSLSEARFLAFGRTELGKYLIVVYTVRIWKNKRLVRIISARPMKKKERALYEKAISKI